MSMHSEAKASCLKLSDLKNVGKAFLSKFEALGVSSVEDLASTSADDLYVALCRLEGERLDPCVHDVFAATIHQAQTGQAIDWWAFTTERKDRQEKGDFPDV